MDARELEYFYGRVQMDPNSGCWLWTASLCEGYAVVNCAPLKGRRGHRIAYEHFVGPVPDGLNLDHLCRVRCCVNPQHLEPVTHLENVRRGDAGKHLAERTHCPSGHAYDEANTRFKNRTEGGTERVCRTCQRIRAREESRARTAKRQAGREPKVITHCPKGHEYTPDNVLIVGPWKSKRCRECNRQRCKKVNDQRAQIRAERRASA